MANNCESYLENRVLESFVSHFETGQKFDDFLVVIDSQQTRAPSFRCRTMIMDLTQLKIFVQLLSLNSSFVLFQTYPRRTTDH